MQYIYAIKVIGMYLNGRCTETKNMLHYTYESKQLLFSIFWFLLHCDFYQSYSQSQDRFSTMPFLKLIFYTLFIFLWHITDSRCWTFWIPFIKLTIGHVHSDWRIYTYDYTAIFTQEFLFHKSKWKWTQFLINLIDRCQDGRCLSRVNKLSKYEKHFR